MRMCHIVICGLFRSTLFFSHYLKNGQVFQKKIVIKNKMCFDFTYIFVWNTFHFKDRRERYDKNLYWSSCKVTVFCRLLMKHEFSRQIFEKYSYFKIHENSFSGSRVVSCWQTDDGHNEFNSRFSQFANVPKILHSAHTIFTCFFYVSQEKHWIHNAQRLIFTAKVLFTARYGLGL